VKKLEDKGCRITDGLEDETELEAEPHREEAGDVTENNNSLEGTGAGLGRESEREESADQMEARMVPNERLHGTDSRTEA
jgi:hypothetical protein